MNNFEPITITSIIEKDVSRPLNEGTPGSVLYRIPFQLSQPAPAEWAEFFSAAWDHPPSWTSSHRPGISSVMRDRVWLNGTTLEEVERTHKATLQLALGEANEKYANLLRNKRVAEERLNREAEAHERHVSEAAKRIKFD